MPDKGKPSEITDPAYWEAQLAAAGCLTEEQEQAGLEGESGGLIVSLIEGVDEEITRKLAEAGDRQKFMGSPTSMAQLYTQVATIVNDLSKDENHGPIHFVLRRSCTTSDDTLVVYCSKGVQYHWNTRNILNYNRNKLKLHVLTKYHAELQVLEHNNYTQLI